MWQNLQRTRRLYAGGGGRMLYWSAVGTLLPFVAALNLIRFSTQIDTKVGFPTFAEHASQSRCRTRFVIHSFGKLIHISN